MVVVREMVDLRADVAGRNPCRRCCSISAACVTNSDGIRAARWRRTSPSLRRADPGAFGIAVVTTDGHLYEVGDSRHEFTIQSISKPFVFGLALEQHGREKVMERVGVEPSGNAFNAIVGRRDQPAVQPDGQRRRDRHDRPSSTASTRTRGPSASSTVSPASRGDGSRSTTRCSRRNA